MFLLQLGMWRHQRFWLLSLSVLLVLYFSTDISFAQRASGSRRNLRSGIEGQISLAKLVHINTLASHTEYVYQTRRSGLALRIYSTSGRFIKSIRSQAGGHFRTDLSPGSYRIVPAIPPSWPRVEPVTVNVAPRQFASIQLLDPILTFSQWSPLFTKTVGSGVGGYHVIILDEP